MLSLFKRVRSAGSQIGVYLTSDDPLARAMGRLSGRRISTVSVLDPGRLP